MSKRRLTLAAILLPMAIHPVMAQDWAGKGRAAGRVVTEAGEAVEGAMVTLVQLSSNNGPEPFATNKKGRWSYLGLGGGTWKVVIQAEGFKISEGTVPVNEFTANPPVEITIYANPYAAIDVGDTAFEAGDFAAARAEYEKAAAGLDPAPAARLRARIGDTYYQEGNMAAARGEYEKALPHIEPGEQVHIRLQLANSYQQEQQYAKARAEYEKALPLLTPEGKVQVMMSVARGQDLEGDRSAAIATLEKANETAPANGAVLQLLADLLTREGRENEARAYLDQMPEDAELPTDMVLNIGIRLYNEGDTDKAYEYFDRAVREDPTLAESYYYRGLVRLSRSENDGATADFKKLLELDPASSHAGEVKEFLAFLESGS